MKPESKEQQLVDICFDLVLTVRDDYYKPFFDSLNKEQLADWVAKQLRQCGFDTQPIGASWGVLKEK